MFRKLSENNIHIIIPVFFLFRRNTPSCSVSIRIPLNIDVYCLLCAEFNVLYACLCAIYVRLSIRNKPQGSIIICILRFTPWIWFHHPFYSILFFMLKNHSTLDKYPSLSSTIFFEHTNNKLIVRMRKEKRKKPLGKWNFILVGNFACFRYTGITMSMAVIAFALNLQIRVATSS